MDSRPRILVTGASGFVGKHLVTQLRSRFGAAIEIVATNKDAEECPEIGSVIALDVTDDRAVADAIDGTQPTHVVHLSGVSAPSDADADPRTAWEVNTLGTLSVAKAILRRSPHSRLVFASSGLVYGSSGAAERPFTEAMPLSPSSDYAATKAAADLMIGAMASRGLQAVRLRLFNHTGPGQSRQFVVPNFAAQIARIEAGMQAPELQVGSLKATRDFLDVRDVVAAYIAVIERSSELPSSPIINIATGRGHTIEAILSKLIGLSHARIEIREAPASPDASSDRVVGDPAAAARLLGWSPKYGLKETLASVLGYWRQRVSVEDRPMPPPPLMSR